ncbi:hypothetical protein [Flavobacterium selenitireducens]|uniref:hypothetical protein n=1 Tax=Flavobacterium selenitireducens TaxID=2722704 RepID=UPI00168B4BAE|nr:hypothetical protein [Flavobacterium selenitireducens]MBD3582755.1 hypothetical protein [Flavobacterium selenitireducens]
MQTSIDNLPMATFENIKSTGNVQLLASNSGVDVNLKKMWRQIKCEANALRKFGIDREQEFKRNRKEIILKCCTALKFSHDSRLIALLASHGFIVTETNYESDLAAIEKANELRSTDVIVPEILSEEVSYPVRVRYLKNLFCIVFDENQISVRKFLEIEGRAIQNQNDSHLLTAN